jgi:hypothetical protein
MLCTPPSTVSNGEHLRLEPFINAHIAAQQQLRDEDRSQKVPRWRGQANRHMFKAI